jgi:hypothetical protein
MKNVIRKIWFHEFQRECSTRKKKPKLTKRQETKFMMTKKEPEHFLSSGQGKSFFSEGKSILSHYRGTFPWKVGIKKILEHWVRYL